jgi:hypothetical protein
LNGSSRRVRLGRFGRRAGHVRRIEGGGIY